LHYLAGLSESVLLKVWPVCIWITVSRIYFYIDAANGIFFISGMVFGVLNNS
jgi:hypothetical protein